MRPSLRRYGSGTVLCLLGVALLLAGTAASLGYVAALDERPRALASTAAPDGASAVHLSAVVDVEVPLLPVDPLHVDLRPPVPASDLPSTRVDRELGLEKAGVGVGASLALRTGEQGAGRDAREGSVATSSQLAVLAPGVAPAVVAAAALTLGGLVAYFWTSLQAFGAKHVVLPAVALYAKISRAEVFDNAVRERIFDAIRQNPGVSASDLARAASVSWGTTIYHLDVLEQTQMVTSLRHGRYRPYFVNGAPLAGSKEAAAVLRNPVTASVVEILRARPGVTQKELADAANMSPQALHWHLMRLVGTGLVRKEREGRVVRHFAA